VRALTVLYDARCGLCSAARRWLEAEPQIVPLELLPADSEEALRRYPTLAAPEPEELVVISDEGQVYLNDRAWIMVFYALEEYREWSYRLAHPLLMPLARKAYAAIAKNRYAISRWLQSGHAEEVATELRRVPLEPCGAPQTTISDYLR